MLTAEHPDIPNAKEDFPMATTILIAEDDADIR